METSTMFLTGLKGVLASATVVGVSHVWRRSPIQQRRAMRRVLAETQRRLEASPIPAAQAAGPFPRRGAVRRLRDMLASPPKGPIVVTGAEGTGTSSVAKSALAKSGAPLLLRLNLMENPPSGGKRPFLRALMSSSGYFTRQREAVDLGMLKEGDSEMGVQHDVNDFLLRLTEVFKAEKEAKDGSIVWDELESWWTDRPVKERPLPVVFIDEVHTHAFSLKQNEAGSDFGTFLRWALHVTSGGLAHVMLVARPEQIVSIEESNSEFHALRQRMVINYPPMDQVRKFIAAEAKGDLTEDLVNEISSNIGGQLKNLRLFAHTIQSHRSSGGAVGQGTESLTPQQACQMLLQDLVADSNELVLRTWDRLVRDGDDATNRLTCLKRALRFLNMAKIIADKGALPRQSMVNQVFRPAKGASASEIEDYVAKGLLTYCSPPIDGTSNNPISVANGELWLSAASPLIRRAFAHLASPELAPSHELALEKEILKLELQNRDGQLSRRLAEQSARIRASAELLKVGRRLGIEGEEKLGQIVSESSVETVDAMSELRRVRKDYDELKWKNKWKQ